MNRTRRVATWPFAILVCLVLAACQGAANYRIGLDGPVEAQKIATLKASFYFRFSEIDGKAFDQESTILAHGTSTIQLQEGLHSFKFKYCDCNLSHMIYTKEDSYLEARLVGGKVYEIHEVIGNNMKISFFIREVSPTSTNGRL